MGLHVTLACGDYDRTSPLRDGRVKAEGLDLNVINVEPDECFWRMLRFREFDVAEMSMGNYVTRRARGQDDFIGIPVFLSRYFRHSSIYINKQSGIAGPEELKGKRIGLGDYPMTAAVWVRGFLQDDYGVKASDVQWVTGGYAQAGRAERDKVDLSSEIDCRPVAEGKTLFGALLEGEIDAVIAPRLPKIWGHPDVTRLFPAYQTVEQEYYQRTGFFPIMHVVVIRKELYEAHPWVAQSLNKAFRQAKETALAGLFGAPVHRYSMPLLLSQLEEQRRIFGDDPWTYGLEPNRRELQTFLRYMREQGIVREAPELESLFAPSCLNEVKS